MSLIFTIATVFIFLTQFLSCAASKVHGPKTPDDILSYLLFNWKKKSLLQLSKIFNIMLGNDFKQNIGNYYTIFLKFEIRHFFLLWILSRETQIVTNVHNESLNLLLNIFYLQLVVMTTGPHSNNSRSPCVFAYQIL